MLLFTDENMRITKLGVRILVPLDEEQNYQRCMEEIPVGKVTDATQGLVSAIGKSWEILDIFALMFYLENLLTKIESATHWKHEKQVKGN